VALKLLHLALQLVPVEDGSNAVVRGRPFVAVDTAHDAEKKDNTREGSQDLEYKSGLRLVMRLWVEVGWSRPGTESAGGADCDLATGGVSGGSHNMVFSRSDGGFVDYGGSGG